MDWGPPSRYVTTMIASAPPTALLTVAEMTRADAMAIAGGVPGTDLMEAAGRAVADAVLNRFPRRPVLVLCGPGNNGGDGFAAARLLAQAGWPVRVGLLADVGRLKGDAAAMAGRWSGAITPLSVELLDDAPIVVDALFGAGLARALDGIAAEMVRGIAVRQMDAVAVDMPSGVHGDSGAIMGVAAPARVTVTFFRPKPGHYLYPGRGLCGDLIVADIGIPDAVLAEISPTTCLNGPPRWTAPAPGDHKYSRGHGLIVGGARLTGAARLAAAGARRMGAGLLSIAAPPGTEAIYAAGAPGVMVHGIADYENLLADTRINAVLVGPGGGVGDETRRRVEAASKAAKRLVLDAGALTSFAGGPEALFKLLSPDCVLTPHEGEFARLFGAAAGSKLERARDAARRAGCVVVLKGADTVIAAPGGVAAINANAPPWLASGGTGDVLAGMILGLLAQGMEAFQAASAAVWCHGAAAGGIGPGLIAEDLAPALPAVIKQLR